MTDNNDLTDVHQSLSETVAAKPLLEDAGQALIIDSDPASAKSLHEDWFPDDTPKAKGHLGQEIESAPANHLNKVLNDGGETGTTEPDYTSWFTSMKKEQKFGVGLIGLASFTALLGAFGVEAAENVFMFVSWFLLLSVSFVTIVVEQRNDRYSTLHDEGKSLWKSLVDGRRDDNYLPRDVYVAFYVSLMIVCVAAGWWFATMMYAATASMFLSRYITITEELKKRN